MLPLFVGESANGNSTFEIEMSDAMFDLVIDAGNEVTIVVPDDATKVKFWASNNFYWSRESFTIPNSPIFVSTTAEPNPGVRFVEAGETLYVQAINDATIIHVSFYKGKF